MPDESGVTAGAAPEVTSEEHNGTQRYEVLIETAHCLTSVGRGDEAQRYYEKAASLAPDDAAPYVGLGVAAMQKNAVDDAEVAFRVACRLDPNCAKAYAGLAMVAQHRNDHAQAFKLYLKCLELENDNMTALLGLFQSSCRMGSFERIIHYLQVYLNMHPGDTAVMFALGALYKRDDRLAEACKMLGDIVALAPQHTEAANLLEEVERGLAQRRQFE